MTCAKVTIPNIFPKYGLLQTERGTNQVHACLSKTSTHTCLGNLKDSCLRIIIIHVSYRHLNGDSKEHISLCKQCQIELHLGTHSEETTGDKNLNSLPPVVY
jgi:hypothetical protein